MPMSNYGRVIHQTQVEQMTVAISGVVNKPGFNAADWCAPITHFGQVLEEIKAGVPDREISARHPGWCGDVLRVCHKIVDGTLSNPTESPVTEEQFKKRKELQRKRERERKAAYRRRYVKGRNL